jgi:hypothetical protein
MHLRFVTYVDHPVALRLLALPFIIGVAVERLVSM